MNKRNYRSRYAVFSYIVNRPKGSRYFLLAAARENLWFGQCDHLRLLEKCHNITSWSGDIGWGLIYGLNMKTLVQTLII